MAIVRTCARAFALSVIKRDEPPIGCGFYDAAHAESTGLLLCPLQRQAGLRTTFTCSESAATSRGTCLPAPPTRGRYAPGSNAISIQAFQQDQNRRSCTMKPLLLAAAFGILAGGALAQNAKGTGAETRTTTTTNPEASMALPTPSDEGSHAARPSGTDRPNMKATKSAQDQYQKEGKSGASLQ